jgi:hypothetical protein
MEFITDKWGKGNIECMFGAYLRLMHHEESSIASATMHTTGGIKARQKGKPSKLKMF